MDQAADSLFDWKALFSWNSIGWYVALFIGVWGALMGTGDYSVATWFFLLAALLFCVKWGHVCQIHLPSRRLAAFSIGTVLAVLGSGGVVVWGSKKTREANEQKTQLAKLDALPELQRQVEEIPELRQQITELQNQQQISEARQQQAEDDLKLFVRKSGEDTRSGVAQDIRQSPIKVEVNGSSDVSTPKPIEAANFRLLQAQCVKEHEDAPYCQKLTLQTDRPANKVLVAFHMSGEWKYLRNEGLPGAYQGLVGNNPDLKDNKVLIVAVTGFGAGPRITPDHPWTFYFSSSSAIKVTQLEKGPDN